MQRCCYEKLTMLLFTRYLLKQSETILTKLEENSSKIFLKKKSYYI